MERKPCKQREELFLFKSYLLRSQNLQSIIRCLTGDSSLAHQPLIYVTKSDVRDLGCLVIHSNDTYQWGISRDLFPSRILCFYASWLTYNMQYLNGILPCVVNAVSFSNCHEEVCIYSELSSTMINKLQWTPFLSYFCNLCMSSI